MAIAGRLFTEWNAHGLQRDSSPPAGWLLVSERDEDANAERIARGAIANREQLGEQLLATFIQGNIALHQLLTSLALHDGETVCYHFARPMTVYALVGARTTELAIHGWDIPSQLEPVAHLSPESLPALLATVDRAVRRAFRPDGQRSRPIHYRFVVTEPLATTTDMILSREGARLELRMVLRRMCSSAVRRRPTYSWCLVGARLGQPSPRAKWSWREIRPWPGPLNRVLRGSEGWFLVS